MLSTRTLVLIAAIIIIGLIVLYQVLYTQPTVSRMSIPAPKYKATLVNYYATWCEASLRFKPVWDRFREELKRSRPDIRTVSMVCEGEGLKKCSAAGIDGYPTVILYVGDQSIPFEGSRTILNLHEFVSKV